MSILNELVRALRDGEVEVIDLTAKLDGETPLLPLPPQWPNTPSFQLHEISRYDERGPMWYWNWFSTGEHTGTHFDAPVHWISGKDLAQNSVDTIPARLFVGPACVLDITAESARDADFLVDVPFIENWEREHGRIPAGAWVLLRSGWSQRTNATEYLNVDSSGPHTPGWKKEASVLLAAQRDVLGVGVETVGTDAGQAGQFDPPFCNHFVMHRHGKFGLASLVNVDRLPATGAVVIAAPLKIVGGSGSPVRVIALTMRG
jgi:kynurenine formamidase